MPCNVSVNYLWATTKASNRPTKTCVWCVHLWALISPGIWGYGCWYTDWLGGSADLAWARRKVWGHLGAQLIGVGHGWVAHCSWLGSLGCWWVGWTCLALTGASNILCQECASHGDSRDVSPLHRYISISVCVPCAIIWLAKQITWPSSVLKGRSPRRLGGWSEDFIHSKSNLTRHRWSCPSLATVGGQGENLNVVLKPEHLRRDATQSLILILCLRLSSHLQSNKCVCWRSSGWEDENKALYPVPISLFILLLSPNHTESPHVGTG